CRELACERRRSTKTDARTASPVRLGLLSTGRGSRTTEGGATDGGLARAPEPSPPPRMLSEARDRGSSSARPSHTCCRHVLADDGGGGDGGSWDRCSADRNVQQGIQQVSQELHARSR